MSDTLYRVSRLEQPKGPLVLLHDGLLVAPIPTQSTLARLHQEALVLLGLQPDDTPFLQVTSHKSTYAQLGQQLPPCTPPMQRALHAAVAAVNLVHLRQAPPASQALGRSTVPPPTTFPTLDAYFRHLVHASTLIKAALSICCPRWTIQLMNSIVKS